MSLTAPQLESRFAALEELEQTTAVASRMWVFQADRLADLIALTPPQWEKGLAAEVGASLSVGEGVARTLLDAAWELRSQPRVRTAVLSGRMNPRQAEVVLDELACVDPVVADRILDELLAAGGPVVLRPEQLRRWLNRRALAADPEGARKKRVLAEREETGVRYRALRNGLAQKVTTGPAVDIQTSMRRLDALTPPASPEDGRTRGQLLFDTEMGAVAFAADACGVLPVPVELELELPVTSGAYGLTPVSRLPEPIVIRTDLEGLADIVAGTSLDGVFGAGSAERRTSPGPGAADDNRDAAGDAASAEPRVPRVRSRAVQSLADLVERDLGGGRAQHRGGSPELRLELLIARRGHQLVEIGGHDSEGAAPEQSAPLSRGSVPTLAGHGPIDPDLVRRYLAEAMVRRLFVDPVTGVCAVDPTPIDLADIATAALPVPPPATTAYTPTAAQKRVVRARYQTCAFPGCGGSARTSDLDHAVPFDQGGETTVANLHALCRFHHQVKQRGWSVERAPDGSSAWTSPTGKKYRSTPGEQ